MALSSVIQSALAQGDGPNAAAMLEQATQAGDAEAGFTLAVLYLQGQIVRRNLALSRHWFQAAAELGHRHARQIHVALKAVGVGGARNWRGAIDEWRDAANRDEDAAAELRLIDRMTIDANGDPYRLPDHESIAERPDLRWSRGLLTQEECVRLITHATRFLAPSVVIDPMTGIARPDSIRTSTAAAFPWVDETPFIHALNRRIAAASRTFVEHGEPLQMLCYAPGQQYHPHIDALPATDNQRVTTVLVYLNDDYVGGETEFPKAGLALRGKTGDALIFRNVTDDGRADPAALHAGRPVISGAKYLASRWIRKAPFGER